MLKHIFSTIVDVLFFLVGLVIVTIVYLAILYFLVAGQDATQLTTVLRNQLDILAVVWYLLVVLVAYGYWVVIPARYGYTLAMAWFGLRYSAHLPMPLLVYNLLGVWWRIFLFPVWIYLVFQGKDFGSWMSGITVVDKPSNKVTRGPKILMWVHGIVLVLVLGSYIFIRQVGFSEFIGRFIDYRTQLDLFINQENWSEAQYALDRFVHYEGEQPIATYYRCRVAVGNRDWQTAQTQCEKAQTIDLTADEKLTIQYTLADLYQNTNAEDKAVTIYEQLWKDNRRDYGLIYYAQLLVGRNKAKEAYQIVTQILAQGKDFSTEQTFVLERFQADLAAQSGEYEKSIALYESLLDQINGNKVDFSQISAEKEGLAGEVLFELAKAHYNKKDYSKAKDLFKQAKEKNPSYGDLIDSYLIDIELKTRK